MRGKAVHCQLQIAVLGITPAYAGKSTQVDRAAFAG